MLDIRTILHPTDLSASAVRAYAHATYLAERFGATLHALHVCPPEGRRDGLDLRPLGQEDVLEQLRAPLEEDERRGEMRLVQAQLESDSEAGGILAYAEEHDVDLIVMGTHGRRGADRLLAGSVAEAVVREAPCPVLTVRESAGAVRRVLAPTDFSERARRGTRYALELALLYGARLELLYVVNEDDLPMAHVPLLGPVRVSREEVLARFEAMMKEEVRGLRGPAEVAGRVLVGHPARDIVEHAEGHADLIVMATHGRTGLGRLLLGSVTEKVVRRAPCPVFTVRSFGKDLLGDRDSDAKGRADVDA